MRVVILTHVYPPEHAPAGMNAAELAHELTEAGHQVTVLTGFPSHPAGPLFDGWKAKLSLREEAANGFTVVRCVHSFVPRFRLIAKLWYYATFAFTSFCVGLFQGHFDVLVMQSTPIFGAVTGILLAKLRKAQVFYWVHDVHPESALNAKLIREGIATWVMKGIDSWVCTKSAVVGVLTEDMRQLLLDRGLAEKHVIIQRHWVDEARIHPSARQNGWREKHGIFPGQFVVLHAGTIGYISGASVILEAAKLLQERTDILFLFVGDGPLKVELQKTAAAHKLRNVRFLPFQPEEALNDMQATADVGLVTLNPGSGSSSIPSKMHGYTAAGRPVIASVDAESATASLISEGNFGWVVPSRDANALADVITYVATDRNMCEEKGANARAFFVSEFGREAVTLQFRRKLEILHRYRRKSGPNIDIAQA